MGRAVRLGRGLPWMLVFSAGCDPARWAELLRDAAVESSIPEDGRDTAVDVGNGGSGDGRDTASLDDGRDTAAGEGSAGGPGEGAGTTGETPTGDPNGSGQALTFGFSESDEFGDELAWASCHGTPGAEGGSRAPECDPYAGDASCVDSRPILCVRVDGAEAPEGVWFDFYRGWIGGTFASSAPVRGLALTSRDAADAVCAADLGDGYRMVEFHDAGGGWSFVGLNGGVERSVRHWVAIDDQPANCWNTSFYRL